MSPQVALPNALPNVGRPQPKCHSERSEESRISTEILRCAQDDARDARTARMPRRKTVSEKRHAVPMIAPSVVNQIKRLLAEGKYSQRKIARMTAVSRGTVGAIASGKRPDYQARARERAEEFPQPTGPPRRCPGCGGLVYMPCRLCHVRKLVAESRVARPPARPEERLRLQLSEGHRARYERVRLRRAKEGPGRGGK